MNIQTLKEASDCLLNLAKPETQTIEHILLQDAFERILAEDITAKIPVCPNREIIWTIGFWAAVFAIVFCVVRGLPVVIEAKYLFEKKND